MALIVDTGPLLATFDDTEPDHAKCRRILTSAHELVVIPSPVLVEVDYWIRKRLGQHVQLTFLGDLLSGAYRVEDLLPVDYIRVRQICERYADSDIGFVDAAVLAIVERLNEPKLVTLDRRHFGVMRPRHIDALELIPS